MKFLYNRLGVDAGVTFTDSGCRQRPSNYADFARFFLNSRVIRRTLPPEIATFSVRDSAPGSLDELASLRSLRIYKNLVLS